jgi:hypothetical protein
MYRHFVFGCLCCHFAEASQGLNLLQKKAEVLMTPSNVNENNHSGSVEQYPDVQTEKGSGHADWRADVQRHMAQNIQVDSASNVSDAAIVQEAGVTPKDQASGQTGLVKAY